MKLISVFAGLLVVGLATAAHAQSGFSLQLLAAHNLERRTVGAAPLIWDSGLAQAADAYAAELARTGRWGHSRTDRSVSQGENLWMGTHAAFGLAEMLAAWCGEKRMFRSGVFPNVSRGGSWHDVGHYTQIVWPTTTRIGCGLRSSVQWDYLVCRYSNPGNVVGNRLGNSLLATR